MFTPNVEYNKTKKKNKNVFYILLFSVFSLESASNCLKSENYKEMKKEMTSICTLFVLCSLLSNTRHHFFFVILNPSFCLLT